MDTHAFIFQNLHSMESHVDDNHLVKKHSTKRFFMANSKAKFEKEIDWISPKSIKF